MNRPAAPTPPKFKAYRQVDFSQIEGWVDDDLVEAFGCFQQSARSIVERPYRTKKLGFEGTAFEIAATQALKLDPAAPPPSPTWARDFFEQYFMAVRLKEPQSGLVTGYFEPQVPASRARSDRFRYPLYSRPKDLIDLDDETRPATMDPYFRFGRLGANGVCEYMDRSAINEGGLDGLNLELFWLEDPVEVFFIHIQGSARLVLEDCSTAFVSYAAKTGHRFTAIGKILVERGEIKLEEVSMASIKAWLRSHGEQANALMEENRSYIFFKEVTHPDPDLGPVGAAGVQLTANRSLAIDHQLHTFGTPVFVRSDMRINGEPQRWSKLMIAQDTGSAIVGPCRGDLFIGSGEKAGAIAGQLKAEAEFTFLMPRSDHGVDA